MVSKGTLMRWLSTAKKYPNGLEMTNLQRLYTFPLLFVGSVAVMSLLMFAYVTLSDNLLLSAKEKYARMPVTSSDIQEESQCVKDKLKPVVEQRVVIHQDLWLARESCPRETLLSAQRKALAVQVNH